VHTSLVGWGCVLLPIRDRSKAISHAGSVCTLLPWIWSNRIWHREIHCCRYQEASFIIPKVRKIAVNPCSFYPSIHLESLIRCCRMLLVYRCCTILWFPSCSNLPPKCAFYLCEWLQRILSFPDLFLLFQLQIHSIAWHAGAG
jgi:hypothetical protein